MPTFNNQKGQAIDSSFNNSFNGQNLNSFGNSNNYYGAISRNLSLVTDFLDHKLRKTQVQLIETPCYFYKRNRSKLEITVYSNPRIAKIDVRIIGLKNHDREPAYEYSYDLNGLSIAAFKRAIEDLILRME